MANQLITLLSAHPWLYAAMLAALIVAGLFWLAHAGSKKPRYDGDLVNRSGLT